MKRKVVAVVALAVVLLAQLTIVNGLVLPGGGTPDLVLLCVVALGMTGGPTAGLIAGFCAGLALDLAPPASQLVGQYALVLCLAGYGAGRLRFTLRHSALLALAAAAIIAAAGEVLAAVLTLVLDTPEVTGASVAQMLPPSVLYDVMATPLVMLVAVRVAVALGVSFDPVDDSPALETGGSAAPVTVAGGAGAPGTVSQRMRYRRAIAGDSRAAASGRWLVGDVNDAAPAIGAIGWLAGPNRSRRAKREQARLTAMVTGASPRRGAFWVGRRPPGVVPVMPPVSAWPTGLARLRPGSGVAGSAAAASRPGQGGPARPGRPVRLRLADEQRRRSRAAGPQPARRVRRRRGQDGPARAGPARGDRPGVAEDRVRDGWPAGGGPGGRAAGAEDRVRDGWPAGGGPGRRAAGAEDRVRDGWPAGGGPRHRAAGAEDRVRDGWPAGGGPGGRAAGAEDRVRDRGSGSGGQG